MAGFSICEGLNLCEDSEYVPGFKYVGDLNIHKFFIIWQVSEYVSGCSYRHYRTVLNTQDSE